jgi:hypothetical protein
MKYLKLIPVVVAIMAVVYTVNPFNLPAGEAAAKAEILTVVSPRIVAKPLSAYGYAQASVVLPLGVSCLSEKHKLENVLRQMSRRPNDSSLDKLAREHAEYMTASCGALSRV